MNMSTEPAITVSTISAVVGAVITLGTAFGLHLTAEQTSAIMGVVTVVTPLVTGFLIRRKVTPVATDGPDAP